MITKLKNQNGKRSNPISLIFKSLLGGAIALTVVIAVIPTSALAARCPFIYAPVCGEKNGVKKTYSNTCVAETNGAFVLYNGECRQNSAVCPLILDPVCAVKNGVESTFPNSCDANSMGAKILYKGECKQDSQACPLIYAPVCGQKNGVQNTYGNDCDAKRAGAQILYNGKCGEATGRTDKCRQYALDAVDQFRRSQQLRCGFSDARWHANHEIHFRWCLNTQPSSRRYEKNQRQIALGICANR